MVLPVETLVGMYALWELGVSGYGSLTFGDIRRYYFGGK